MSFDAWIVGFGLSRVIIELKLLSSSAAYIVWGAVILFDFYLLYQYFVKGRFRPRVVSAPATSPAEMSTGRAVGL
jgi:hypothetical protein